MGNLNDMEAILSEISCLNQDKKWSITADTLYIHIYTQFLYYIDILMITKIIEKYGNWDLKVEASKNEKGKLIASYRVYSHY